MIFRNWVLQNFPFLEDDFDALTDYELFCKMMEYVKQFANDNEEFKKRIEDLETYVYNLNIQDAVNNKLDEMAESGELTEIISQYLQLATTYTYNNISEMKLATNLVNGSFARTSGFYSYNDGGGAYYKIRNITNDDTVNEMDIIALYDNNLVAELITNNYINIKQLGAKGDGVTNDTGAIQRACDISDNIYIPVGNYLINNRIGIKSNNNIYGKGFNSKIIINDNTTLSVASIFKGTSLNNITIKDLMFDCGSQSQASYYLDLLSCNNILLENLKFIDGYGSYTRLNDSENIKIYNCIFENISGEDGTPGEAIYGGALQNVYIRDCDATGLRDHFIYIHGDVSSSNNINIDGCNILNSGLTSGTNGGAITIYSDTNKVNVSNCNIKGCQHGVYIGEHNSLQVLPDNINLNNINIVDTVLNAISVTGLSGYPVTNVNINNINAVNNGQDGLSIRYCNNLSINNVYEYLGRYGVEFRSCNYFTINNCKFISNTTNLSIAARSGSPSYHGVISNVLSDDTRDEPATTTGFNIGTYGGDITVSGIRSNNCVNNYYITSNGGISYIGLPTNNGTNIKSIMYSDNTPTTFYHNKGDVVFNSNPSAGSDAGWICVASGNPGTWKSFGTIAN